MSEIINKLIEELSFIKKCNDEFDKVLYRIAQLVKGYEYEKNKHQPDDIGIDIEWEINNLRDLLKEYGTTYTLELSVRGHRVLKENGYYRLKDILETSENELIKLDGMGLKTLRCITQELEMLGLKRDK
jgi:DNA-directed RNA polymerase alpha subunit